MLGNKADCPEEARKVTKEEGDQFSKSRNIGFMEVSAKSGDNVAEAFHAVG